MKQALVSSVLLLLAATLLIACTDKRWPEIASVRELGPILLDDVRYCSVGHSARFEDKSVWIFGLTVLERANESGDSWLSNSWCATPDFKASDGLSSFGGGRDSSGLPTEFLPLTDAETLFNEAHAHPDCEEDCGANVALWPGPLVVAPDGGQALIFYEKMLVRPGDWNFIALGSSVAVWNSLEERPERPETSPGQAEPTLLFQEGQPHFGSAAVVDGDHVYAYGCAVDWLDAPCKLARAPFRDATRRSAWRFYSSGGTWSENVEDAVTVLDGAPTMSVHYNAYLGKFIAVHNGVVDNDVLLHHADRPEGPWSGGRKLFRGLAPDAPEKWNFGGLAHSELAALDGKTEYITYVRPMEYSDGELRLVEVTFR